jgi:hypothetical protein
MWLSCRCRCQKALLPYLGPRRVRGPEMTACGCLDVRLRALGAESASFMAVIRHFLSKLIGRSLQQCQHGRDPEVAGSLGVGVVVQRSEKFRLLVHGLARNLALNSEVASTIEAPRADIDDICIFHQHFSTNTAMPFGSSSFCFCLEKTKVNKIGDRNPTERYKEKARYTPLVAAQSRPISCTQALHAFGSRLVAQSYLPYTFIRASLPTLQDQT